MTDIQKQRLYGEGINKNDFAAHKDWYQNCPECHGYFNKDTEIPTLLNCGHVCCQECAQEPTVCICCKQKKVVKVQKFKLLVETSTSTVNQGYDFSITMQSSSRTKLVCNKGLNTTFQQILTEFNDFVDYEKIHKENVRVVIKTKLYYYKNIKKSPISQYQQLLSSNNANKIAIVDMFRGGI